MSHVTVDLTMGLSHVKLAMDTLTCISLLRQSKITMESSLIQSVRNGFDLLLAQGIEMSKINSIIQMLEPHGVSN